MYETSARTGERAILVGVGKVYALHNDPLAIDHLEELSLLADTAGAEIAGVVVQSRDDVVSTYYIGKGKAEELKLEVERTEANLVIFDNDLTPAQGSNLEKLLGVKVIDRSALILDIFALRARTRQAKTQVELAQLKYMLPRLTRQWTHLSRQEGGIGMRGPGETQLEVDRRRIRQRINHLQEILDRIDRQRETGRKSRAGSFKAALVGYTNAGKSTLLNALSGSDVPVENKLFKTLDSVTRLVRRESSPDMLLSDTVGFIRNLPHDLVASFKSTLDEVREADALIHVIDITNPEWEDQHDVVLKVLGELGVSETPVITVFNKIDALDAPESLAGLSASHPDAHFVSAHKGTGFERLEEALAVEAQRGRARMTRRFGSEQGALVGEIYRHGRIEHSDAGDGWLELTFTMPYATARKLGLFDTTTPNNA